MWIAGEDDDFDEMDMAAAIAAEQAEKDGGGDGDDFDEMDMAAAIAAEQAEKDDGGGDDFDEMDMAAAIAAEQAEKSDGGDGDDFDDMDMAAAIAAEQAERGQTPSSGPSAGDGGLNAVLNELAIRDSAVQNISIDLTAVLGVAEMKVSNLLKIGRGAVIELDRRVGDAIELRCNGRAVANGDVVVVDDHLAISIQEIFGRTED